MNIGLNCLLLVFRHQVKLVNNDQIGDFKLVYHELSKGWSLIFLLFFSSLSKSPNVALFFFALRNLVGNEVFEEVFGVNHSNHGIDLGKILHS